jgi:hypothetical protein
VNPFMFCEPLQGRRWVDVTEQRSRTDWAHQIKELVDVRYPQAERIVLVMDNLNTHTPLTHCMRRSSRKRPSGSPRSWRSTTHPSTAPGSTWPRSSSVCSAANASIGECPTSRPSSPRREPGRNDEMPQARRLTGASARRMHASSSSDSILHFASNGVVVS